MKHLRYRQHGNAAHKSQLTLVASDVIISYVDVTQDSNVVILVLLPEGINSTAGNTHGDRNTRNKMYINTSNSL